MNKVLILILLLTSFLNDTRSQSVKNFTLKQQEKFSQTIGQHFQYIDSVRYINADLIEVENNKLEQTLKSFSDILFSLSDTLSSNWLNIIKSSDKKICIVSWDTRMGGTMIEYATIVFFKGRNGRVQSKKLINKSSDGFANSMMHYDSIYTIQNNEQTFYIAQGFGQGSTALPWQEVRAFSILGDKLTSPNVFPQKKANIFVEFDTHKFKVGQKMPTIKIKNDGKMIVIPMPTNDEGFSGRYKTLFLYGQVYKAK